MLRVNWLESKDIVLLGYPADDVLLAKSLEKSLALNHLHLSPKCHQVACDDVILGKIADYRHQTDGGDLSVSFYNVLVRAGYKRLFSHLNSLELKSSGDRWFLHSVRQVKDFHLAAKAYLQRLQEDHLLSSEVVRLIANVLLCDEVEVRISARNLCPCLHNYALLSLKQSCQNSDKIDARMVKADLLPHQ